MKHGKRYLFRFTALVLIACMLLALPVMASEAILREGAEGTEIADIQERLEELGFFDGRISGIYDAATAEAVRDFQRCNDLLETGCVDAVTKRVLFSDEAVGYYEAPTDGFLEDSGGFPVPMLLNDMAMVSESAAVFYEPEPMNTNEYHYNEANGFQSVVTAPLSTFAADADTASYAQMRAQILSGEEFPAAGVRVEEMLNYFRYDYAEPTDDEPFGVTMELSDCPWNEKTKLLLIGLQAERIADENRPGQNLVFLLDVSGSMDEPDKLPLVKRAFGLLLDTLAPTDTVSLVTYASRDQVLLDGVSAANQAEIRSAIENLTAGGSTAGAAGIQTAYEIAQKHFLPEGNNRILLATDGDLNVGISDEGSLIELVEEKRESGVMLSVFGFGYGNYKDNKMEALADYGNGNYQYIDTIYEARRTLVTEAGATFFTVAKDVKLQVDFNPAKVKGYRLIGYENRVMAAEDFADDTKDGGEIGSGHRMTALYEIVPKDSDFDFGAVESKYQTQSAETYGDEWLTLNIRAKKPDADESDLFCYPLTDASYTDAPSDNFRFAAAVVEVGMLLTDNEWKGSATYDSALELLRGCESVIGDSLKEEFLYITTLLQRAAA